MKIIKKGRERIGWARELECTGKGNRDEGCGAILLVELEDLFETSSQSYGDSSETHYLTFKCMSCLCDTDLESEDWPCHWAELDKEKERLKRRQQNVVEESKKEG